MPANSFAPKTDAGGQLLGFGRGEKTLAQEGGELRFVALRTGKAQGSRYGFEFSTEVEHRSNCQL